tara:strand:+ start:350 stop:532 length:183 start_codon:yes stop_codon:yes gene_type:complete
MFIAEFLTLEEKTNYNVRLNIFEYIQGKLDRKGFLLDLGEKYNKDFTNKFYFKGVKLWIK